MRYSRNLSSLIHLTAFDALNAGLWATWEGSSDRRRQACQTARVSYLRTNPLLVALNILLRRLEERREHEVVVHGQRRGPGGRGWRVGGGQCVTALLGKRYYILSASISKLEYVCRGIGIGMVGRH
jgi:hypothetical protein